MKGRRSARIGIRELRQSLSVYLRRVADGEAFEVTEHGRPVAILAPLPQAATALDRLAAAGRVSRPLGDLRDLGSPVGRVSRRASAALRDLRAERL